MLRYNLTEVNEEVFFAVNSAIQLVLFFLFALPTLVLCCLCVIALLLAKAINWQIRVVLINVFAAEIVASITRSTTMLHYPAVALADGGPTIASVEVCKVFIALFILVSCTQLPSITLYAIMVYLFVKYNSKKLKWYVIIPYISIDWIVSLVLGISYASMANTFNDAGFCGSLPNSFFFATLVIIWLVAISSTITTLIFAFLTIWYIKHNILEENKEIKKAIAKNLFFFSIGTVMIVIINVITTIHNNVVTRGVAATPRSITIKLAVIYIITLVVVLLGLSTPVVALIILKPIRDALKQVQKKICSTCKKNTVQPADEVE